MHFSLCDFFLRVDVKFLFVCFAVFFILVTSCYFRFYLLYFIIICNIVHEISSCLLLCSSLIPQFISFLFITLSKYKTSFLFSFKCFFLCCHLKPLVRRKSFWLERRRLKCFRRTNWNRLKLWKRLPFLMQMVSVLSKLCLFNIHLRLL